MNRDNDLGHQIRRDTFGSVDLYYERLERRSRYSFEENEDEVRPLFSSSSSETSSQEEIVWNKVTCPSFHKLIYYKYRNTGWACDARRKRNENWVKARFGILESEHWHCLSGCTDYDQMSYSPVYSCRRCDFDLCQKCYDRADKALKQIHEVQRLLSSEEKVCWMHSKLMVVGEGKAGKTSTVRTLLGNPFNEEWESTIGANLTYAKSRHDSAWNEIKEEDRIDHSIQAAADLLNITTSHETKATESSDEKSNKGSTMVELDTRRKPSLSPFSMDNSKEELEDIEAIDMAEVAGKLRLDLFGNKSDLNDSIKYTIWDFGGQSVFYSLHHLFLTKYGSYLLVFNLATFFDDGVDTIGTIRFWLNSIKLHANKAPVLLVGTHVDQLQDTVSSFKTINVTLSETFDSYKQVHKNESENLYFFPLNNKTSNGVDELRAQIEKTSRMQEFLHMEVSIRWLRTLDLLTENQEKKWISILETQNIAENTGVYLEREIELMLKLFHNLGVLIHFDTTEALQKVVVINPQWLIDELGKLIRDIRIHKYDERHINSAGLDEDLKILVDTAVASYDLLHFLWGKKSTNFFIDLMARTMLISSWPYNAKGDALFLVPSLLNEGIGTFDYGVAQCKFDFSESYMPDGCFQRLVCLCLDYCVKSNSCREPQLSKNSAKLFFVDVNDFLCLKYYENGILVSTSTMEEARTRLNALTSMMRKVNQDIMGSGLQWKILYHDNKRDQMIGEDQMRVLKLPPWFNETEEALESFVPEYEVDSFLDFE